MSVFGVPPQTSPGATVPTAVLFPSTFGNPVFSASDTTQQPQHSSHSQQVFCGSAVFPGSAGRTTVFGAQNTSSVTPFMSTPSVLPTAAMPAGFKTPVFGAASSFGTAAVSSSFNTGTTTITTTAASSTPMPASLPPNSVFASSVFQKANRSGDVNKKQKKTSLFAQKTGGGVPDSMQLPQSCAAVSPPVYPEQGQGPRALNPMSAGTKRVRGGSSCMFADSRGAGRVKTTLPPTTSTTFAVSSAEQVGLQQEENQATSTDDVGNQLLSTRVFSAFLGKILDDNEAIREEAAEFLEDAFFGVVGSHGGGGEFSRALRQMLSVWQTVKKKQPQLLLKGDHWVALFALGCHLNFLTSTILAGEEEHRVSGDKQRITVLQNRLTSLTNSCMHANLMCEISLQLYSNQCDNHVPYSVLPFILRRVRNTFELANDEGVLSVQPNMKTTLLKLHRYVRVPSLQREPQSVVERERAAAFAYVLGEMMLCCCAPADSGQFIQSFHQHCSTMLEIRCTLYHHYAHNLLQEPLTDAVIKQAMEFLAKAFVIIPDYAKENKRLLFVKLSACGLALGRVPSPEEQEDYDITELEDVIVAIRSSNIHLFNIAMRNNSEFYVQCGIHNVLQVVGKRIALLMVVKYYAHSFSARLSVQDMIKHYELPFSVQEGCHVWLLPLLVERRINGVMDSGVLVLSSANPFDEYSKEALIALAANDGGE